MIFMQSQTKEEMFTDLEQYHKILQNKNLKAALDKSHFFFFNHSMQCAMLQVLASAQHCYNHIVEQIK